MTALECLRAATAAGDGYQLVVNEFIDDFRHAHGEERNRLVADPISQAGALEGRGAGVVSALCREAAMPAPAWTSQIASPAPFFAFPARSFEMRLRLMVESPPAFRVRRVFVPSDYLSRA